MDFVCDVTFNRYLSLPQSAYGMLSKLFSGWKTKATSNKDRLYQNHNVYYFCRSSTHVVLWLLFVHVSLFIHSLHWTTCFSIQFLSLEINWIHFLLKRKAPSYPRIFRHFFSHFLIFFGFFFFSHFHSNFLLFISLSLFIFFDLQSHWSKWTSLWAYNVQQRSTDKYA